VHPQGELAAGPDAVDAEDQGAGELDLEKKDTIYLFRVCNVLCGVRDKIKE
jgi:hypothetical protein